MTIRTDRVNQLLGHRRSPTTTCSELLTPLGDRVRRRRPRSFPRGVPTSSARSTSSRKSRAASGSTSIKRTVPSNPAKIGALTTVQRERRAVADVLIGAGYDEVYTLPLVAAADLARAGRAAEALIEVENPLRAEESVLRPALLPGLLRAVGAQRRARQSRRRAVRARPRVRAAGRRARRCRSNACTSRSRARAGSCGRRTRPTAPVTVARRGRGGRGARPGAAPRRLAAGRRRRRPGSTRCAAANIVVDGDVVGSVGEIDADVVDALGAAGAGRRARARRRRVARRRARAARARGPGLALSRVGDRPRVRRRRRRSRRRRCCARCATAGGELLESVRLFDVFRSDALGAGKVSLAFALRVPRARPHAHRRRGRRAAPAVHRRGGLGVRRRAAGMSAGAVRAPDPRPLRRGRRPGRGVQRALADVLRRDVHPVRRVVGIRPRLLDQRVRRDAREGRARVDGPGPLRRVDRRSTAETARIGTKSFDVRYRAVGRRSRPRAKR